MLFLLLVQLGISILYRYQLTIQMLPVLPPGLQTLHISPFGTLALSFSGFCSFSVASSIPSFRVHFLGQQSQSHSQSPNTLTYNIHCSVWHFILYLQDMGKIKVEVVDKNAILGEVWIDVKEIVNVNRLESNIGNAIEKDEREYEVRTTAEGGKQRIIGSVKIAILTEFNQKLCEIARQFINPFLQQHSLQHIDHLPIPIPATNHPKLDSCDEILDMINQQCKTVVPNPIRTVQKPMVTLEEQSRLVEDDIDRMVAEMESREYDSSKYQDSSRDMGYKSVLNNTSPALQSPLLPVFQVSEYSIKNPSVKTMAHTLQHPMDFQASSLPFTYSNLTTNKQLPMTPNPPSSMSAPKSLKLQIFQLSFSNLPYSDQQHSLLSLSKLIVQFPNKHCLSFVGKRSGETVAYDSGNCEVEVDQRKENGAVRLFRGEQDRVVFRVEEIGGGQELAYGVFELDRLKRAEGRGVFVVGMNNRNLKKNDESKQTMTVSPYQVSKLKPVTMSLYSLRIGMELLSHVKDKVYQLRLTIDSIEELPEQQKELQIRYKLFGSQQNMEIDCRPRRPINHNMVMPILLQPLIKDKSPKLLLQTWSVQPKSLIGLTQLDLSQIPKILLRDGKLDETLLSANLYPTMLYKGPQIIRNLISKKQQGILVVSLGFGNAKQINRLMEESQKPPVLVPEIIKEQKKVVLPYDEKLGVFIKERKEVREVDVQVEPGQFQEKEQENKLENKLDEISQIEHPEQNEQTEHSCLEQVREISITPQPIIAPQVPSPVVAPAPPTLTSQYIEHISSMLSRVLSLCPTFVPLLKSSISPYLLFSFIEQKVLQKCIISLGIDEQTTQDLLSLIPITVDSTMLSVNPLYDYFSSFEISHTVSEKLISEELFGEWMMERYVKGDGRWVEDREDLQEQMAIVMGAGKVGRREAEVLWGRVSKKARALQQWQQVVEDYTAKIHKRESQKKAKQSEEDKILQAIYAISDDSHISQQKAGGCLSVTLRGYPTIIQSAQTLLSIPSDPSKNHLRVTLLNHNPCEYIFSEDTAQQHYPNEPIPLQQFYQQRGSVELVSENKVVSKCAINLEGLALGEQIDKTYALKTNDGSFCGLVRLAINYLL